MRSIGVLGSEKADVLGVYPACRWPLLGGMHADARKLLRSGVDPMEERKAEKVAGERSF